MFWRLRPRLRFRLSTLLIGVALLCLLLTAVPFEARQYKQHKGRMRALITTLGGEIETLTWSKEPSPGANWLSVLLGYVEPQESLWRVSLAGTSLSADDLEKLSGCRWIVSLSVSNANVGDDALTHVATLQNLVELRLRNTKVTDAGISRLKSLSGLLILDVAGTDVTYQSLAKLEKGSANLQEQLAIARARAAGVVVDLGPPPRTLRSTFNRFAPQSAVIASIENDLADIGLQPDAAGAINLAAKKLTSGDDEDLRRLTSATSLAATGTIFPIKGLEFASKLKRLQSVSIDEGDSGNLRDNDLRWLAELPGLNTLELRSPNFTRAGLSQLTQCTSLTSLTLEGNRLTDEDIEPLARISKLEHLALHGDNLTPALLEHLKGLAALGRLELNLWYISDGNKPEPVSEDSKTVAGRKWNVARPPSDVIERARRSMHHLAGIPSLKQLSLMGNLMVIEVLGPLTKLKSLEWLKVDGRFVSHDEARQLQLDMPHCHVQRIEIV